jgi:putative sugar O-methyltransferase
MTVARRAEGNQGGGVSSNGPLEAMFKCFAQGDATYHPSKFWNHLNHRNVQQLETEGYQEFKQTLAQNYFTFVVGPRHTHFRYLLRHTSPGSWPSIFRNAIYYSKRSRLTRRQQLLLRTFTLMLWKLAERVDTQSLLQALDEPTEGHPFKIMFEGKLISQDLANSVLEYYSIHEHFKPAATDRVTICELGAGYGRNAYVFANTLPNCRYIIVDIPPALYVSQRYLSSVLPGKKVFPFRCFEDYSAVASEIERADIVFLLPHQAALLPQKSADLFINISSLHEMTPEQIRTYFTLIDRLTKGYFYSKQSLVSTNIYDELVIGRDDYPVPPTWQQLYLRPAAVQCTFFEAMYAVH